MFPIPRNPAPRSMTICVHIETFARMSVVALSAIAHTGNWRLALGGRECYSAAKSEPCKPRTWVTLKCPLPSEGGQSPRVPPCSVPSRRCFGKGKAGGVCQERVFEEGTDRSECV